MKGLLTYKVKFIFFKMYKCEKVVAFDVNEAEQIVCDKYSISKTLKKDCSFKTTRIK